MRIVDLAENPREEWRKGVLTRMRVSARNGAGQLCLFEQWCEPGHGAPTHLHAVEEVLHVLEGEADVWVGTDHARLTPGQLMLVPAGIKHGFSIAATGRCISSRPWRRRCSRPPMTTSARRRAAGCRSKAGSFGRIVTVDCWRRS